MFLARYLHVVADKLALGLMLTSAAPICLPILAHYDLGVLECRWTHRREDDLCHPFLGHEP